MRGERMGFPSPPLSIFPAQLQLYANDWVGGSDVSGHGRDLLDGGQGEGLPARADHSVKFCAHSGSRDVCQRCPRSFALFKRTSSFAYENCQVFPLVHKNCSQLPGNPKATLEDVKNCYCKLERGQYYLEPEVYLGPLSFCQVFREGCSKGEQPTHKGVCEPCPRNTVQDEEDNFFLCRPQRNCTAMGLATEKEGNTQEETVCAKPPPPPSHRPLPPTYFTSTSAIPIIKPTTTTVISDREPVHPSVAPVLDAEGGATFNTMHIATLSVSGVLLLIIIITVAVIAHRKRWCTHCAGGACHRHYDAESRGGVGGGGYPGAATLPPCDNDNSSEDSCCDCANSCLASSSSGKTAGGGGGGGKGKKGAGACTHTPPCKPGRLWRWWGWGEMSEPLYNSISHDEAKLGHRVNDLATYQNVHGVTPTFGTGSGLGSGSSAFDYNYPSKVRLPSVDSEEDSLKKGHDLGGGGCCVGLDPVVACKGKEAGKDREDFTETDPLLPNLEVVFSSTHHHPPSSFPPLPPPPPSGGGGVLPPLRGILRNGPNRQEPEAAVVVGGGRGGGAGEQVVVGGNRPNLSLLLSSVENSSPQEATQPPTVNTTLVQMDELKPAMSLAPPTPTSPSPSPAAPLPPTTTATTTTTAASTTTGAANVRERKDRTDSPARINPSQQKEVRSSSSGSGGSREGTQRKTSDTKPAEEDPATPKSSEGAERRLEDETLRKEAMMAASPEDETARKSVGGSSGLGESLDLSSSSPPLSLPSEDGRRSRSMYRRSNSEASRSVSPQLPLPPSRSISSPGDKHRPYAVVKPMQSDQSLDALSSSPDQLRELTRPLDSAGQRYPLHSLHSTTPERQSSQGSSDEHDEAENA
ncbi:hypothetical protein ACOMHN_006132 [Nucella lapillus]